MSDGFGFEHRGSDRFGDIVDVDGLDSLFAVVDERRYRTLVRQTCKPEEEKRCVYRVCVCVDVVSVCVCVDVVSVITC